MGVFSEQGFRKWQQKEGGEYIKLIDNIKKQFAKIMKSEDLTKEERDRNFEMYREAVEKAKEVIELQESLYSVSSSNRYKSILKEWSRSFYIGRKGMSNPLYSLTDDHSGVDSSFQVKDEPALGSFYVDYAHIWCRYGSKVTISGVKNYLDYITWFYSNMASVASEIDAEVYDSDSEAEEGFDESTEKLLKKNIVLHFCCECVGQEKVGTSTILILRDPYETFRTAPIDYSIIRSVDNNFFVGRMIALEVTVDLERYMEEGYTDYTLEVNWLRRLRFTKDEYVSKYVVGNNPSDVLEFFPEEMEVTIFSRPTMSKDYDYESGELNDRTNDDYDETDSVYWFPNDFRD